MRLLPRMPRRSIGLSAAALLLLGMVASAAPADTHGPTVALPDQFLGGYVEAWQNQTFPDDVPHANMTLIAFATTTPNRNVEMSYGMPADELRASIAANNSAGKPTILSLGGSGGWHAPTSQAHAGTMATDIIRIAQDYGFSGLDVNFEGGSEGFTEANAPYTADMMRQVNDHFAAQGQPFSLSMAPYGADRDGSANNTVSRTYLEIMKLNTDIIDFVGFQYYNTGFEVDTAWVRNVLDHWKSQVPGMTNDQWAIGYLGQHDWGGSNTPYGTMVDIWNDLQDSHPGIRGVWTWGVDEKETSTGNGFFNAFAPVIDADGAPAPTTDEEPVVDEAVADEADAGSDEPANGRFSDVRNNVHADAIERMAESGAITGYADGTFRPSRELTRGQLASLIARGFDLEVEDCDDACARLSDIDASTHGNSVRAVVDAGIASGYPDGTFRPDRTVTREQLASFLAETVGLPTDGRASHPFDDVNGSAHEPAIGAISAAGITAGSTPDTFAPKERVRRDQMATFLDRTLADS